MIEKKSNDHDFIGLYQREYSQVVCNVDLPVTIRDQLAASWERPSAAATCTVAKISKFSSKIYRVYLPSYQWKTGVYTTFSKDSKALIYSKQVKNDSICFLFVEPKLVFMGKICVIQISFWTKFLKF